MCHFLQRGRNQARQSDHVGLLTPRHFQNLCRRHHYAHIHYCIIVTLKDYRDDILADIMNIPLDRGDYDLALGPGIAQQFLFRFNIRQQVRHRLLHDAG